MAVVVLHEWSKPTPEWVEKTVRRYGTNIYGDPLFRIVWSETRKHLVGGIWEDHSDKDCVNLIREVAEYRWVPVYGNTQRWVLETWCPPEKYGTPAIWEREFRDEKSGLLTLGPFPSRGDYEHSYTFEYDGQYVPLTPESVEAVCYLIEKGREYSYALKKAALEEEQKRKDREWEERAKDIIRDAQSPFHNNTFTGRYVTGEKKRKEDIDFNISADELTLPKRGFFQHRN